MATGGEEPARIDGGRAKNDAPPMKDDDIDAPRRLRIMHDVASRIFV
jgi:hypothetical protein